jgi:hypothetical protein
MYMYDALKGKTLAAVLSCTGLVERRSLLPEVSLDVSSKTEGLAVDEC